MRMLPIHTDKKKWVGIRRGNHMKREQARYGTLISLRCKLAIVEHGTRQLQEIGVRAVIGREEYFHALLWSGRGICLALQQTLDERAPVRHMLYKPATRSGALLHGVSCEHHETKGAA